jgi:hypothetical protein
LKKANKVIDDLDKKERKLIEFGDLIDTIESADEKKKYLWKEIYNNAVSDREYASVLYTQLFSQSGGSPSDHVTSGPMLIKYLERMGKCTDQLIKLAEMIEGSDKNKALPDDMYEAIQEK